MHTIDAQGKKLGRVAVQAAILLMGKNRSNFKKNVASGAKVKIINASKLDIDSWKLENIHHTRYTGYPGGLIHERLELVARQKGYRELLRHAVRGMIPANKLRNQAMKNLLIME